MYSYEAEQHFSKEDGNKNVLTMTAEITCHSGLLFIDAKLHIFITLYHFSTVQLESLMGS